MKAQLLTLSLVVVLGFSGLTHAGEKHSKGIHGKVISVTGTTFTMTISGKNDPNTGTTVTVDTTGITVDGTLSPGEKVVVVGGTVADSKVTGETSIVVGHKHKKDKAPTTAPAA